MLYRFLVFIWTVYLIISLYLNYKMGNLWLRKEKKELLFIPFYVFFFFLSFKIDYHLFWQAQTNPLGLGFNEILGMVLCSFAILLFVYVTFFEESFPSCLTIKQGKPLQGIYNYIRHPSYYAFFLITFGTAFSLSSTLLFILACINHVCLYFYYMIEENQFIKKFPNHKEYLKKTRRFLPTLVH